MNNTILVAGGTGHLGQFIVNALLQLGADVRLLSRPGSNPAVVQALAQAGAHILAVDPMDTAGLVRACTGAGCVVSALAGLRPVVVDAQQRLLDAAVSAGVPRFIPSDYSLDFTPFEPGENRNLDWRRAFHQYLDRQPIAATSIFNGAFMELLTGDMPLILPRFHRILYWGRADHPIGFTAIPDVAVYTAHAALDPTTPRYLHIAGDLQSPRAIQGLMSELSGQPYRLFRAGGARLLGTIISVARTLAPAPNDLYPAWQGMQYMHNMIDDRADLPKLDNDRYPGLHWTTIRELLMAHQDKLTNA